MGTFRVNLWVGNLFTDAGTSVEALVDTGATYSMIPGSVLDELGILPVESRTSRIADGSRVDMQTSWARFSAEGNAVARVSFGPEETPSRESHSAPRESTCWAGLHWRI